MYNSYHADRDRDVQTVAINESRRCRTLTSTTSSMPTERDIEALTLQTQSAPGTGIGRRGSTDSTESERLRLLEQRQWIKKLVQREQAKDKPGKIGAGIAYSVENRGAQRKMLRMSTESIQSTESERGRMREQEQLKLLLQVNNMGQSERKIKRGRALKKSNKSGREKKNVRGVIESLRLASAPSDFEASSMVESLQLSDRDNHERPRNNVEIQPSRRNLLPPLRIAGSSHSLLAPMLHASSFSSSSFGDTKLLPSVFGASEAKQGRLPSLVLSTKHTG